VADSLGEPAVAGRLRVTFGVVASAADAPGTSDADIYRSLLEDVEYHAELGFQTMWLIEHHFSDYFPTPSPLILASHIAGRFPELSLGTCVVVLPWYEPLRLAGEIAMLSLLMQKPLHLGIGRGTAKYEFDAFGLDMADSRERFKEIYEVISAALKGEPFAYHGTQIDMPKEVAVRPRVAGVTTDRIHFYGAIGSPSSAPVMAEMGLPPMCTTIGDFQTQAGIIRTWEDTARAHGFPTDGMKPIMINCIVADTDREAIEQAQLYIPRFMQAQIDHYTPDETNWEELPSYRAWKGQFAGMKAKTDPANIPSWAGYQLVGSPETVAQRVQAYMDLGFNHLFLHTATPGVPHDVRRVWTKRFMEEVAPRFTGAGVRPAADRTSATAAGTFASATTASRG
jgi:alkanesulfonate monooxygenase SsuD/methylene tetrahydromethanopterin reductase-like flavin-dependent oxidoreductase (luciferase family)